MIAFTEKFGKVEILTRTGNSLKVELESGEVKTLMPMFIKFKDENGNEIVDFSQIEENIITKENANENDVVIFIESLIHIYGYQLMKLNHKRFANISTLKSTDERKQIIIDYYTKFLESKIVKIKNEQDFELDNIFNYMFRYY